ncbi:hypothetical protein D3C71_1657200 [compost metagenome]
MVLAKNLLANARDASFMSQYQLVVCSRPSVFFRPRLWISVRNTSRPAVFIDLLMPNSLAALIALMVSPPALARPRICALEAWACSRKEEKSDALSGCLTPPSTLPPLALITAVVSVSSAWPNA